MPLRLATFNVENLFDRAKALNTTTWAEGRPILEAFDQFNTLANQTSYSDADKQAMLAALDTLRSCNAPQLGACGSTATRSTPGRCYARTAATSSNNPVPVMCRS
jgi:hypothetical protein